MYALVRIHEVKYGALWDRHSKVVVLDSGTKKEMLDKKKAILDANKKRGWSVSFKLSVLKIGVNS